MNIPRHFLQWARLLAGLALLFAALAAPARSALAQDEQATLDTRYFTIRYPVGSESVANYFAGFADDEVDTLVSLLGAPPIGKLRINVYPNENLFFRTNSSAATNLERVGGVYVSMNSIAVGVIADQLQPESPSSRLGFRQALAATLVNNLSDSNLPLGFRQGFAQFFALSPARSSQIATDLKQYLDAGLKLWSWEDLNLQSKTNGNLEVSALQIYTLGAFFVDRYGVPGVSRFLQLLRDKGEDYLYTDLLTAATGTSADELEVQWRAWATEFAQRGGVANKLLPADLYSGEQLYNSGDFAAAASFFSSSEALYKEIGQPARVELAASHRRQAEQAQSAVANARQGRTALEAHDYAAALSAASSAATDFAALKMAERQQQAAATAALARTGLQGTELLAKAQGEMQPFDILSGQAATDAHAAAELLAQVGDADRVARANALLNEAWRWLFFGGAAMLALALALILAAAWLGWRLVRSARAQPKRMMRQPQWWM